MSLPSSYYWTAIIILLLVVILVFYVLGKNHDNKRLKGAGVIIAIIFLVVHKWIFPNVYTVRECGTVDRQILLFPKTENKLSMAYGKHCYIINKSNTALKVETIFYGGRNEINSASDVITTIVLAHQEIMLNTVAIEYFFEPEKESVTTKSDGLVMYKVSCK